VDARIAVPMAQGSESLNAAAAAAVVLFEAVRQRSQDAPASVGS
jgi:tRNA G18 (ribose-2'-O)-methylase SpoU